MLLLSKEFYKLAFSVFSDASSSNEAVHLQQRLRSLSTELVTLRNRLHVGQPPPPGLQQPPPPTSTTQPPALPPANKKPVRSSSPQPPRAARGQLPIPAPAAPDTKQHSRGAAPPERQQQCPPAPPVPPVSAPCTAPPPMAPAELEDLIHLPGPLTEDAVLRALQARFAANNYYVSRIFHFSLDRARGTCACCECVSAVFGVIHADP